MTDSLEKAASELRTKIAEHVAAIQCDEHWQEIQKLYAGLGVLEGLCGHQKTELSSLLGIKSEEDVLKISNWEFAGMQPLDAAKKYLRMIAPKQKAAPLSDILRALDEGGLKASRDDLRISLSRSTYEVYKISEDVYGLLEFFPHVKEKRGGGKKKPAASEEPPDDGARPHEPEARTTALMVQPRPSS
jgi:hypothetical protein